MQIEPRIFAYRANDKFMIEAYTSGRDLYATMASEIYHVPYEECQESFGPEGKARRTSTKSVLLGILYGRQAKSIGEQCGMNPTQAKKFVEHFFKTFPSVKKYMDDTIRMCRLTGYVTTIDGRRRRLPDINSPDKFRKAEAERQAVNASIQGRNLGSYVLNSITQRCA